MKFINITSALLFVALTNAHSDFIKDGNRAKLFEMMDDEVPNFKVYLPEDELEQLKKEIGYISAIHDPAIAEEARNSANQWGNWGGFGGDNTGDAGGDNPFGGFQWGGAGAAAGGDAAAGAGAGGAAAGGAAPAGGFQWGGFGAGAAGDAAAGDAPGGFQWGGFGAGAAGDAAGGAAAGDDSAGAGAAPAGGFQWGGAAGGAGAASGGAGAAASDAPAGGFQWGGAAGGDGQAAGGFDFANFNFEDFFNNTDFDWSSFQKQNFKVKDAKLEVEIKGQKLSFDKVSFGVGGSSSRTYARQAFNLKIRGKKDLFGRNQFRIRSDNRDATYLRSKLACDIHNRLGIPSISANYISLYVNDEYWGFYVFFDAPKPSWAELEYGDKDSTHVYKCKNGGNTLSYESCFTRCMNEDEEVTDHTEWGELLKALDDATSADDIEDIFDVDQFLIEMIYEYLSGSWDHFLSSGHNFSVYKMPQKYGGKWTFLLYDFDADFGQDVCSLEFMGSEKDDKDYPSWSWSDWNGKPRHIVDFLINNHPERFNAMMKKIVEEIFNPDVLFPHIDELKKFIKPYVLKDKTPVDGKTPGMLNENATGDDYSMAHWEANSEFTNIGVSAMSSAYGLKFWILERYRKVCKDFKNINCIDKYLDLNYYYDLDRSVEGPINTSMGFSFFGGAQQPAPETPKTTQSQPPKPKTQTITQTVTQVIEPTVTSQPTAPSNDCLAASLGYPCCSSENAKVYYQDEIGDWSIENNEWCGVTNAKNCWSASLGYPCCTSCTKVWLTDSDGKWGVENNVWCGIPTSC